MLNIKLIKYAENFFQCSILNKNLKYLKIGQILQKIQIKAVRFKKEKYLSYFYAKYFKIMKEFNRVILKISQNIDYTYKKKLGYLFKISTQIHVHTCTYCTHAHIHTVIDKKNI